MLKKSFTLASAVSLTGAVVWIASTAACGGDEETPNAGTSSGTTTSSSGGDPDGGGASSSSSGSTSGQDAGFIDPNTIKGVDVVFGKCEAFNKCDGPIEGKWEVTGGCLADTTFDTYRQACAGLKEKNVIIKAGGNVEATAATATPNSVKQTLDIFLQAEMDVPESCLIPPFASDCKSLEGILTSGLLGGGQKFDHAQCVDNGDQCGCKVDVILKETTNDEYELDGTGVLTTKQPPRSYEYCPSGGDKITYRETSKDAKAFGMFLTISKK